MSTPGDRFRLLLTVIAAFWVIVFVYSFFAYSHAPHEGPGFPDGLNKPAVFLGWQGIAALLALAVFGVGRRWPPGSAVRRLSWVPLLGALAIAAMVSGVLAWFGQLF